MKTFRLLFLLLLIPQIASAAGDVPATYGNTYRDWPNSTTPLTADVLNNEVDRSRRYVFAEDKDVTTPPVACDSDHNGYTYVITGTPAGDWAAASQNDIAICAWQDSTGTWVFVTPREGHLASIADEDTLYRYNGSSWAEVTPTETDPQVGDVGSTPNDICIGDGDSVECTLDPATFEIAGAAATAVTFDNGDISNSAVTITHSLGSQYNNVKVYDNTGTAIEPDQIIATDTNNLNIVLASFEPIVGTWTAKVTR